MRAVIGLIVIDFPTAWAKDAEEYFLKAGQIHHKFRNSPLVNTAFAPHSPYAVSEASLLRLNTLAEEMDIPILMHVHETSEEIEQSLQQHGKRRRHSGKTRDALLLHYPSEGNMRHRLSERFAETTEAVYHLENFIFCTRAFMYRHWPR